MPKVTLAGALPILLGLLFVEQPTATLQCGCILIVAMVCWHFDCGIARGAAAISAVILAFSSSVHDESWQLYLLAPMAIIAAEGMIRLRRHYDSAEHAANIDRLTGALTPRGFEKMLDRELRAAHRQSRTTALIFLDLDHFKDINDRYGHAEGDHALIEVVKALRHVLFEDDHIARIGGDEFLVFLRFAGERSRLEQFQDVLIDAVSNLPWQITASAGGIIIPPSKYAEPALLVRLADGLMYDVKRSGRGRLDLQHLSDLAMRPASSENGRDKILPIRAAHPQVVVDAIQ
ncbi:GGDEF domain-containing protein [Alteraurantiacibacter palmitatis]|uniref:diguanylate cyclase n=1 Tax=Alteraurantiacibacter palmitatis TaxID=2054628 RepID=A0ABV7E3P6_9SPHN